MGAPEKAAPFLVPFFAAKPGFNHAAAQQEIYKPIYPFTNRL